MIPTGILVLKALPLTPTGKVNRKSLPDPGTARMELEQTYVSPATLIEKQLAGIWQDVLKIEKLGIHDNFFDLGGHSLAVTRVAARVISEFHLELPVSTLFQSPSIAEMAAVITEHLSTKLGEQDLERISTELESLSDEEARRLAAKQPVAVRR